MFTIGILYKNERRGVHVANRREYMPPLTYGIEPCTTSCPLGYDTSLMLTGIYPNGWKTIMIEYTCSKSYVAKYVYMSYDKVFVIST